MRRIFVPLILIFGSLIAISPSYGGTPEVTHQESPVCSLSSNSEVRCHSWQSKFYVNGKEISDFAKLNSAIKAAGGNPNAFRSVSQAPLTASDLRSAYIGSITATGTVAIVDVYDPNYSINQTRTDFKSYLANDTLGTSDKLYIYNQVGVLASSPSTTNATNVFSGYSGSSGWGLETALDIQMVAALCPLCTIQLVLAKSASFADLNISVGTAAGSGPTGSQTIKPTSISNSYGSRRGSDLSESSYQSYTNAALNNIAVTASSGDNGYGISAPASFNNVIGIGGTSLTYGTWAETAWSGAGSGCSKYNKTSYQSITNKPCGSYKAVADLSAVADPNTGVLVYYNGGQQKLGGTSVAAPIIATLFTVNSSKWTITNPTNSSSSSYIWTKSNNWRDVVSGSNGSCNPKILCTAGTGWDGPTGLGSPKGVNW